MPPGIGGPSWAFGARGTRELARRISAFGPNRLVELRNEEGEGTVILLYLNSTISRKSSHPALLLRALYKQAVSANSSR